jgi:hypothetical protein
MANLSTSCYRAISEQERWHFFVASATNTPDVDISICRQIKIDDVWTDTEEVYSMTVDRAQYSLAFFKAFQDKFYWNEGYRQRFVYSLSDKEIQKIKQHQQ